MSEACGQRAMSRSLTKGERCLLEVDTAPNVSSVLPDALRRERVVSFDLQQFDVYGAAAELLACASKVGVFTESKSSRRHEIESYRVRIDVFRNFGARQVLFHAIRDNSHFLALYERLVCQVVLPKVCEWMKAADAIDEEALAACGIKFHYQWPPTMRLQPGPSAAYGRAHADSEYGHQSGELNFWMPLTSGTPVLLVESTPGASDFHPLNGERGLAYGEIACFHGALCQHYAPPNDTERLRASLDFRIGVGSFFDPAWTLPGVKAQHTWRSHLHPLKHPC